MNTREFLRRYAYVYLYVAAFFLGCAALVRHTVETVGNMQPFAASPVIDAGHGGPDGGPTGAAGTAEDRVNLAVARRLEALLALLGCETAMTRTTENSLASEGKTIRAQKQSDLRNRVELVNALPAAVAVSIHQNHFPDPRYSGPQVFYRWGRGLGRLGPAGPDRCPGPGKQAGAEAGRRGLPDGAHPPSGHPGGVWLPVEPGGGAQAQ